MRFVSGLTALLVAAALYLLVMERDRFLPPRPVADVSAASALPEAGAVSVLVQVTQAQTVENAVLLRGRTEAARSVEVRAETTARVVSDPLRRGAFVNAGEVLCRLDPGTRADALAEAEARLAEAEMGARNAEALTTGGFGAEIRRLAAQSALMAATAAAQSARRDLERLEIRAPFSGLLEDDAAELGALLQAGGLCARVIQLDPIRLVGFAAEADVGRIEVGALAGGRLADGTELAGRVTFLARSADPMTRTFRVEVTVPNADLGIRDGQTADMLIGTEGVKAHLIPASVLTLDDAGRVGVRLADDDDRARFVPVRVLRDTAQGLWVTGLPETARLIVRGQDYVTEGVALAVSLSGDAP
ncbi:MAG: efflux RND transporter periplasmic adaptor subunit [Gemmobacter sp.]|nr:efflux RND transporter periplasmic adaptor subunit [Gemmobacter sp.]